MQTLSVQGPPTEAWASFGKRRDCLENLRDILCHQPRVCVCVCLCVVNHVCMCRVKYTCACVHVYKKETDKSKDKKCAVKCTHVCREKYTCACAE